MLKEEAEKLVLDKLQELGKNKKLLEFSEKNDISYGYLKSYKSRKRDRGTQMTKRLLEIFLGNKVKLKLTYEFITVEKKD